MSVTYKTTLADLKLFKKECRYWIRYFGLKDWEILMGWDDKPDNRASCYKDFRGRICTITLSPEWNEKPVKYEVQRCAFHEVCELLLGQLDVLCRDFYATSVVTEYTHDVIRRLENSVFRQKRMK